MEHNTFDGFVIEVKSKEAWERLKALLPEQFSDAAIRTDQMLKDGQYDNDSSTDKNKSPKLEIEGHSNVNIQATRRLGLFEWYDNRGLYPPGIDNE